MTEDAIQFIKDNAIQGIVACEDRVSEILSDIVEMIARDDHNLKWPQLLPSLREQANTSDPVILLRVFRTAAPIFRKIRFMPRSDKLYTEILYNMEHFGEVLHQKTEEATGFMDSSLSKDQEKIVLEIVRNQMSCYKSLNSVEEWPEFFEERFQSWKKIMFYFIDLTDTKNPSILMDVKRLSVEICNIVGCRFREDSEKEVRPLFEACWRLLPQIPANKEYSQAVQSLMNYV